MILLVLNERMSKSPLSFAKFYSTINNYIENCIPCLTNKYNYENQLFYILTDSYLDSHEESKSYIL